MNRIRKIDKKTLQLSIITVALFIIMVILKPDRFLSGANIESMLFQLVEPGLFAMCIAIAYLAKGIDLSIVSTANLVGITSGIMMRTMIAPDGSNTGPIILLCVVVSLVTGVVCGLINGFFIARMGIFPILVTLGTQNIYMGIGMALTQGRAEGNFPQALLDFGNCSLGGIPLVTVIFLVLYVLLCIVIHKTPFGRKVQWMGSNSKASWYTGINNTKVTYTTYVISGVIAAICGIIVMSRTNSAKADYGQTYVFQALLTCVLAGISPLGGRGKLYNLILSVVAIQVISTGFNMLRVSPLIRDSIFGFLLVFSIVLDYILEKRRADKLNKAAVKAAAAQES